MGVLCHTTCMGVNAAKAGVVVGKSWFFNISAYLLCYNHV